MAIAAYAVGASSGYVYCRAEYPLAVARLRKAIREAAKHGYLGASVMDTQFAFEVDVRLGADAISAVSSPHTNAPAPSRTSTSNENWESSTDGPR